MNDFITYAKEKLSVDKKLIFLYCVIYFFWGLGMNQFGEAVEIAKFSHWTQVITTYVLYMVPISLLLRGLPIHMQYAYGMVAMAVLEFCGYAFKTSYVYPDNILDYLFSPQNFSLAMVIFFAAYFPIGNWGVGKIYELLFKKTNS